MTGEQLPGESPEDRELEQRWQRQSDELPGEPLDDAIRAAARRELDHARVSGTAAGRSHGRAASRWMRYAPLAAAASVAVLAVGLVRLMPRDEVVGRSAAEEPPARAVEAPAVPRSQAARETEAPEYDRPLVADTRPGPPATKPPPPIEGVAPSAPQGPVSAGRAAAGDAAASVESTLSGATGSEEDAMAARRPDQGPPAQEAESRSEAPSAVQSTAKAATARSRELQTVSPALASADSSESPVALPSEVASLLRADAADRSGIAVDQVRIVSAYSITWPDGSMGCGKTGESAIQVLIPGYVVDVDAAGTRLRYHTNERSHFRVCADDPSFDPGRVPADP